MHRTMGRSCGLGHLGITCEQVWLRGRGNGARLQECGARPETRRQCAYRQQHDRRSRRVAIVLVRRNRSATAPSSEAIIKLVDGLSPNGKLMVIAVTVDPIDGSPAQLIS